MKLLNSRHPRPPRAAARRAAGRPIRLAATASAALVLLACSRQAASPNQGRRAYVSFHEQPTAKQFAAFTKSLGWPGGDVTEYSDVQRLDDGTGAGANREYGPIVRVAAIDDLDRYSGPADFATPRRVALMLITQDDNNPMPARYRDQGWAFGFVCIYLKHQGANPGRGWAFGLAPAASASDCPVTAPGSVAWNGKVARITPSQDRAMYPVTARLEETSSGGPVIGLSCGAAWCYLGVADERNMRKPDMGGFVHPRAGIPGWLDDQELADGDATARQKQRPRMRATVLSLVPNGTLDLAAYHSGNGMKIAEVYVPDAGVPAKYSARGLRQGLNEVWLRHDPSQGPNDGWSAAYNPGSGSKWYFVHFTNLDPAPVPHVARWGWSESDETLWAACYTGCCEVTDTLY